MKHLPANKLVASAAAALLLVVVVHAGRLPSSGSVMRSIDEMSSGVNLYTGQSVGRVVEYTYNFNNTWVSPSGVVNRIPDQLTLNSIGTTLIRAVDTLSQSFSTVFERFQSGYWVKGSYTPPSPSHPNGTHKNVTYRNKCKASASYSRELHKTYEEMQGETMFYSWSKIEVQVYNLVSVPAYVLKASRELLLDFMGLPPSIKSASDSHKYNEFVISSGTHYPCAGVFGGHAHQSTFLERKFQVQYSDETITNQMGLMFHYLFFNVSAGGFHNRTSMHFDEWFYENKQAYSFFKGGAEEYQHSSTSREWMESIPQNAGMINVTLCPLTDLLPASDPRTKTLSAYIDDYLGAE